MARIRLGFLLLAGAALPLSSCVVSPVEWSGSGGVGGVRPVYGSSGYPGYWAYPARFGYGRSYRGWGCHRVIARCGVCGHHPCRCRGRSSPHGHHHRHHDHGGDHRECKYRIISGDLEGKVKPKNYHTLDWFHERGYNLENLKVKTEEGKVIDRRPSSQKKSDKKKKKKK